MEVKNPLFLDDPTPVQKGTIIVKSNQLQKMPPHVEHSHQPQFKTQPNDGHPDVMEPTNKK